MTYLGKVLQLCSSMMLPAQMNPVLWMVQPVLLSRFMRSSVHQALIKAFCSFIEFQADRFLRWIVDPRLRRSMERRLTQSTETSEKFWALYWYRRWQTDPQELERSHLIAHLQEPCYWASYKAAQYLNESQYSVSDCFQLLLSHIDRILAGFKIERGASLRGYAKIALPCLIRDILRQRQDAHLCSNWALLRRVSKRQLLIALRQAGLSEATIAEYRLSWVCYKACYEPLTPGNHRGSSQAFKQPEAELWEAIATLYNQERLSQLSPPGPSITARLSEERLSQAASWLRTSLYPPIASLNIAKSGEDGHEWQDNLSDSEHDSLVTDLIAREDTQQRSQQHQALNQVLETAIAALPHETQQLLVAYYQEQLPQREIAEKLAIKQYTVSRRLTRIRETLLKQLAQWSQDSLHISITPDQVLMLSTTLEDWLDQHYRGSTYSRSLPCDVSL